MKNITDKYITKIEGHGSLEIDWKKSKAKLHIHEGERLFEGILVGRKLKEAYWITPRICGVCPIAHNLASVKACEDGLGIKVNNATYLLRELMNCGQMIQSHILHLFFLSLPDYLGIDRGTELAKKNPKALKTALNLKEMSDEIAHIVAGRNVHPTTTAIGGFLKVPSKSQLEKLLKMTKKTRKDAEDVFKLCANLKYPELKTNFELVAQNKGEILSSKGDVIPIKTYKKNINEQIKSYSTAKFGKFKKREMMVGSLARIYFSVKDKRLRNMFDFKNPFHNNLAQGLETLLYHQEEEAPRGGLYHEYHFNKENVITYANIITPTVQNLTSIENSANALIRQYKGKPKKEIERLLNMLVRAYDPCITCSVH
jgi:coenzyme F420-reducing hydrogenase alpha subunit